MESTLSSQLQLTAFWVESTTNNQWDVKIKRHLIQSTATYLIMSNTAMFMPLQQYAFTIAIVLDNGEFFFKELLSCSALQWLKGT